MSVVDVRSGINAGCDTSSVYAALPVRKYKFVFAISLGCPQVVSVIAHENDLARRTVCHKSDFLLHDVIFCPLHVVRAAQKTVILRFVAHIYLLCR